MENVFKKYNVIHAAVLIVVQSFCLLATTHLYLQTHLSLIASMV